jgi:hypothetical protein
MNLVFHAHSGLRYLVFLMALVTLVVFVVGQLQARPFGRVHRVLGASYAGLVHLQATLGLILVALGKYYPRLLGHLVLMLAVAVVLQLLLSMNRRLATPTFRLPLIGVTVSLVGFVGGLAAIGRGLFETTAFGAPPP